MTTVREVAVKLQHVGRNSGQGARAAAIAMGNAYTRGVVTEELSRYAHPAGTATPSPPGQPPARVTGALAASVLPEPPKAVGEDTYMVEVGGRVVYARIQELGGASGRGHRTILPPRPYLRPATERMVADGTLTRVAVEAFRAELNL